MNFITHWLKVHFILAIVKQLTFWLSIILVYCLVVYGIERYFDIRTGEMGGELALIQTIILSLLMSFRNRSAYERWWEGRKLWGQLVNDSRNLAIKLKAYVPREVLEQSGIKNLLMAFPIVLKRHLRGDPGTLNDLPGLESEATTPGHLPIYVASRIVAKVTEFERAGHIKEMMFRNLDVHLNGLMDVCGACERIANTPFPFSYKAMLRTGLVLHFILAPWFTLSHMELSGIPVLLLVCLFLLGMELIDSHIEEPFGHDEDDLDLERYAETIGTNVKAILAS